MHSPGQQSVEDHASWHDSTLLRLVETLDIPGNAVTLSVWGKLDELPSYIGGESYAGIFDSEQDSYVIYLDKNNDLFTGFEDQFQAKFWQHDSRDDQGSDVEEDVDSYVECIDRLFSDIDEL